MARLFVPKVRAALNKRVVKLEFHVVVLERRVGDRLFSRSRMPFGLALFFVDFAALHEDRAHKASSNAFSRKAGS
jgi:hypothetical protein